MSQSASNKAASLGTAAGVVLGLCSAVGYTLTNILLRYLATDFDPGLVSCLKAAPTVVIAVLLFAAPKWRNRRVLPTGRLLALLIGTGLAVQLGGNLAFQFALARIGLALTVPVCFGTLIFAGAAMGRVWLGEPITPRTLLAMGLFVVAIGLLAWHAEVARNAIAQSEHDFASANGAAGTIARAADKAVSPRTVSLGLLAAGSSGVAYALSAVVIRSAARSVSVAATLGVISFTGVVSLGTISVVRVGFANLAATDPVALLLMISAGIINAGAFFALGKSLKHTSVSRSNMLNASQVAMAAIAGVALFDEPADVPLALGVALTLAGLLTFRGDQAPAEL
ncbi:MAG: DMT family transporter [Pirellulales bacterium]|nr:DMT family transporter [Pirellulales bacterium]